MGEDCSCTLGSKKKRKKERKTGRGWGGKTRESLEAGFGEVGDDYKKLIFGSGLNCAHLRAQPASMD